MRNTIKNRNSGTMTEAAYWGWIRSLLRKGSLKWKPLSDIQVESRRPYTGENRRRKWEYQCNICKNYFSSTEIEVDHINGTGGLTGKDNLAEFVENLFCEKDKLQVLCVDCHLNKTKNEGIKRRKKK